MEENKRIEIVSDENSVITFDTIVRDVVNREEVAVVEAKIEELKQHIAEKNAELEALIVKVAYAKHIIEIADEKKARELALESEVQTPTTEAQ